MKENNRGRWLSIARKKLCGRDLPLDDNNQGSLSASLARGEPAILVISGTTPFTTEEARFELEIK